MLGVLWTIDPYPRLLQLNLVDWVKPLFSLQSKPLQWWFIQKAERPRPWLIPGQFWKEYHSSNAPLGLGDKTTMQLSFSLTQFCLLYRSWSKTLLINISDLNFELNPVRFPSLLLRQPNFQQIGSTKVQVVYQRAPWYLLHSYGSDFMFVWHSALSLDLGMTLLS